MAESSILSAHRAGRPWLESAGPWIPEQDVALAGLVRAPRIEIPAGVVLTLTDELVLESQGLLRVDELPRARRDRGGRPLLLRLRAVDHVELLGRRYPGPVELLVAPPGPGEQDLPVLARSLPARAAG